MELRGKPLIDLLDNPTFQKMIEVAPNIKNLLVTGALRGLIGSPRGLTFAFGGIDPEALESLKKAFEDCGYSTEVLETPLPYITNLKVFSHVP